MESSPSDIDVTSGVITHRASGKTAKFGDMASAASKIKVPKEVDVKNFKDFKIIRHSQKNVDGPAIVTGKAVYGMDVYAENMVYAGIVHAPAFGMRLNSFDASEALFMQGIQDVFTMQTYPEDFERNAFDVRFSRIDCCYWRFYLERLKSQENHKG